MSDQTQIRLAYGTALTENLTTRGVAGVLEPLEALATLLDGTGLTYRAAGSSTITLVNPRFVQLPGPPSDVALDMLTVEGSASNIAVNSGDRSAVGFVATRSSAGTKTNTPLIEVPQSITVITRAQLETQNVQSVTEALRYVPGVSVESYGYDPKGFDWLFIRGFNAQATSDFRDGLRQLSTSYSFFRTEPYALERIEVLRGPSSTLYGQSDAGGIINRMSKRPLLTPINEVQFQLGSFGRVEGMFDLTGPVNPERTLSYRLIGVARSSDTQYRYRNGAEIPDDRLYLAPSFTWAPDAATSLTVLADVMRDRSGGTVNLFTTNARPTKVLIGDPTFNRFEQDQATIGYQFEHHFNDVWSFRQNARYGHLELGLNNLLLSGITSAGLSRIARRFDEKLDAFAIDNQLEARFATGFMAHDLLFGLDYTRSDGDVLRYTGAAPSLNPFAPVYGRFVPNPTTPLLSYRETMNQIGVYAQDQIKLGDAWVLTLGGRYDHVTLDTQNRLAATDTKLDVGAFSGRAGLTYLTSFGVAPYVSFAQSFVPNTGVSAPAAGAQPFAPSRGEQWEVGVKYIPPGWNALFTAALFDITKTNVLTTDFANPGFQIATGEIRSRGLELEARIGLAEGWDAIAAFTYLDPEITKDTRPIIGNRPAIVPNHSASGWLNYTVQHGWLRGLSIGGGARYVGNSFGDAANTLRIKERTLLDAAVSYTYGNWLFSVNATNIADRQYITTCTSLFDCYPGVRRTVIGRVKYVF
ncbi:TonB-dependent siderophore receptor [Methylobacterium radiotolerans]|uniref:TonB-dependent siderophore receptor n=1 Tax=Methylobacterium radiotolerans TaxID=31998 RepID=UPI001F336446|nr:TonB-dependent siderophore receptor [Methylobacterium radiotolerans]UIY45291.1 TonB-dependent siderophore receptor [Methylobacterium radiotolerans]